MPNVELSQQFELSTRSAFTRVEANLTFSVNGKELPNMSVLGFALEQALALIQEKITESYKVVPPRVGTPIAQPYKAPEPA